MALKMFRSLDIKQLQLDTLAYLISDHIVALGGFESAETFFQDTFFLYEECRNQSWSLIAEAFHSETYSHITDFYEFLKRLERSIQAVACVLKIVQIELLTKPLDVLCKYLFELDPEELSFSSKFLHGIILL